MALPAGLTANTATDFNNMHLCIPMTILKKVERR